jgi:hypothetical protein
MHRVSKCLMIAGALALLLFVVRPAAGQISTGSLSGQVVDPSGAAVPNAQVTATNIGTNAKSKTTTDSSGIFHLALLPGGTYNVEVTKTGFQAIEMGNVLVSVGVDHGLGTLSLKVGGVSTVVNVTTSTPLLTTTQAQVSNIMPSQLFKNFPGVQENQGLDFIALTIPGVVDPRDNGFSNSNGMDFSVNGLRGRTNDEQIDGQNNNDNSVGGPSLFLSNPDFVDQYQIVTDNFGPEYGRNSGSVVNVITKSGTNNWHGSVVGTEGNSVLNSLSNTQKSFEGLTKVPRSNDEFTGATIGGPLWKNHVFMFGGFDNEIVSSKGVDATGKLTPTPAGLGQMAGCFPGSPSVSALSQFGPFGVGGGNPTVSPGTETTVQLTGGNFAGFTPNGVDANNNPVCNVQLGGVQRTLSNGSHEYDWVYRVDAVVGANDHFYGRYIFNKLDSFNNDSFLTAAAGYPNNVPDFNQQIGLSWTHTLSSRMVNELRYSYGRLNLEFGGNSIGNTIPNQADIGTALSNIGFGQSSLLSFGPATSAPQGRIVNTSQVQDNWSYYRGNHQFSAGVNFTRQRSPNIFLPDFNGAFTFANLSTFAQDVPSSIRVALGDPSSPFLENDLFIYGGDNYKITPNLTLNLGLTWSYNGQPVNLYHNETVTRESNASTAFWDPSLPLSVRTFPTIPAVKNAFGPGVGFAYNPKWGGWLTGDGKTVIRGGYRLAYDPPFYNIYINIASSAPLVKLQTLSGATAAGIQMPAQPTGTNVRSLLSPFLQLGAGDPRAFSQTTVAPNFGPDRVHEWSFGIQREIVQNAVFEARYVGNHATDLFQSINANPFIADVASSFPNLLPSGMTPCSSANAAVPSAVGRVNCNEGVLRERTNTGYSDYNGLQLSLRTDNLHRQLTMRAGYTWSKTTDNVSEIFGTFGGGNTFAFAQNPLNFTSAEHGLSGQDIPQNFTLSAFEELPMFRTQRGVIGHILGGWGIAGTYILSSGQTYTPVQFALASFTNGVGQDTPFDLSFNGTFELFRPFLSNPNAPVSNVGIYAADACNWFGSGCAMAPDALLSFNALEASGATTTVTKSQVSVIANGGEAQQIFGTPFGNVARNSFRDAKTNSANITLFKDIKFWERATLQWHMSLINAFNHPNFTSVDPFIEDAGDLREGDGFGIPALTSGGNRTIKFGLKVLF